MKIKFLEFAREIFGNDFIPLHRPVFEGNERQYLVDCIDSNFVSSVGTKVIEFEEKVAAFTGSKYAVATVNGTAALHVAIELAGVKPGDEVISQPLTFIATCNAISYAGAKPLFVDVDLDTMGLSPAALRHFLEQKTEKRVSGTYNKTSGKKISACVPMHTFGFPCRIEEILKICADWDIAVIEDAAESLGSYAGNQHTGTFGSMATLSFNGNKIISTGGGGVLITDNSLLAKKARHLSTTAKAPHPWAFEHDEIGWNDRLPNINAAIGSSQMEVLEERLKLKRKLYEKYCQILNCFEGLEVIKENSNCINNNWLVSIRLTINNRNELKEIRDKILNTAHSKNLFLRPSWNLINSFKMYKDAPAGDLKIAQDQSFRIINLPSSPQLLIK